MTTLPNAVVTKTLRFAFTNETRQHNTVNVNNNFKAVIKNTLTIVTINKKKVTD